MNVNPTLILVQGISAQKYMCVAVPVHSTVRVRVYERDWICGPSPRYSHEPRGARNESGNGDDPRGL